MTPCNVPGNVTAAPSPPPLGWIVVTYWVAWAAVDVSNARAWKERFTSTMAAPITSTQTVARTMNLARFNSVEFVASDMSDISVGKRNCGAGLRVLAQFQPAV